MSQPADYHMHTPLCRHAWGDPIEYARQAKAIGLTEIGFSDHSPMPQDDFDDWRMRRDQLEDYTRQIHSIMDAVPGLTIRIALEVDYLPGAESWIKELSQAHPWDYFIGSVHYVRGTWDVDNPKKLSEWEKISVDEVWRLYFERLAKAAASGLFQIIGHADLPKKFGHVPQQDYMPWVEPFLAAARESGVAMELNTAGLRKDCREIYPSLKILRRACEMGVPICFGSDAHKPEEVGADFDQAIQLAKAAGYTRCVRFRQRQATVVPI